MNKQGLGKIDWCDLTWNPVRGCLHNCSYCYLKRMARFGHAFDKPQFIEKKIKEPIGVKNPSKIFVCSSADLFGEWVPKEWIEKVLETVKKCPQHTFQFLTKNPKRYGEFDFPENCWLGTTVDGSDNTINNAHLMVHILTDNGNHSIKNLTFISFEPLLCDVWEKLAQIHGRTMLDHIDWIIIGANSNKGAREPPKEWAHNLIAYAHNHTIAVWMKDNYNYPKKIKEFPLAWGLGSEAKK